MIPVYIKPRHIWPYYVENWFYPPPAINPNLLLTNLSIKSSYTACGVVETNLALQALELSH